MLPFSIRERRQNLIFTILYMLVILFVLACLTASYTYAGSVDLAWTASISPDVTGYKVYYGLASGSYGEPVIIGNVTSYTVMDLNAGTQYFFAVTAFDDMGNESGFSNEVFATIPAEPLIITYDGMIMLFAGESYTQQITVSGGIPPYAYGLAADSGTLPDGMTLSTDGVISGVPQSAGTYAVNVQVTDSAGTVATLNLSIEIRLAQPTSLTVSIID